MLYGKNCDDKAKARILQCSKNSIIDGFANHFPTTGKTGPRHQPVTNPIIAATSTSGTKYPANNCYIMRVKE